MSRAIQDAFEYPMILPSIQLSFRKDTVSYGVHVTSSTLCPKCPMTSQHVDMAPDVYI